MRVRGSRNTWNGVRPWTTDAKLTRPVIKQPFLLVFPKLKCSLENTCRKQVAMPTDRINLKKQTPRSEKKIILFEIRGKMFITWEGLNKELKDTHRKSTPNWAQKDKNTERKKRRLLRHLENTVRGFNMLWLRLRIKIREYKVGYIWKHRKLPACIQDHCKCSNQQWPRSGLRWAG